MILEVRSITLGAGKQSILLDSVSAGTVIVNFVVLDMGAEWGLFFWIRLVLLGMVAL